MVVVHLFNFKLTDPSSLSPLVIIRLFSKSMDLFINKWKISECFISKCTSNLLDTLSFLSQIFFHSLITYNWYYTACLFAYVCQCRNFPVCPSQHVKHIWRGIQVGIPHVVLKWLDEWIDELMYEHNVFQKVLARRYEDYNTVHLCQDTFIPWAHQS